MAKSMDQRSGHQRERQEPGSTAPSLSAASFISARLGHSPDSQQIPAVQVRGRHDLWRRLYLWKRLHFFSHNENAAGDQRRAIVIGGAHVQLPFASLRVIGTKDSDLSAVQ